MQRNPNSVQDYWGYALLHVTLGNFTAALDAFERAHIRDPASHVLRVSYGNALICAGFPDEGLAKLTPFAGPSLGAWERFARADGLVRAKRYEAAIAEYQQLLRPGETPPGYMAYAYFKSGNADRAREIVNERRRTLEARGPSSRPDGGTLVADLVAADTAALLRHLAVMIQNKSGHLLSIRCAPHFPDLIAIEQAKATLESGMKLRLTPRD